MTDVRAAAQLSTLPSLIAFNMIHATLALAVGLAAALLLLDGLGWRIVAVIFDRERLITGTPVIRGGPPALAAIRRRARHKRTICASSEPQCLTRIRANNRRYARIAAR